MIKKNVPKKNVAKKNAQKKNSQVSLDFTDSGQDAMLNGDFHQYLEDLVKEKKNVNVNVVK